MHGAGRDCNARSDTAAHRGVRLADHLCTLWFGRFACCAADRGRLLKRRPQRERPAAGRNPCGRRNGARCGARAKCRRRVELARDVAQFNILAVDLVILSGGRELARLRAAHAGTADGPWCKRARRGDGEFNCGDCAADWQSRNRLLARSIFCSPAGSFLFLRSIGRNRLADVRS